MNPPFAMVTPLYMVFSRVPSFLFSETALWLAVKAWRDLETALWLAGWVWWRSESACPMGSDVFVKYPPWGAPCRATIPLQTDSAARVDGKEGEFVAVLYNACCTGAVVKFVFGFHPSFTKVWVLNDCLSLFLWFVLTLLGRCVILKAFCFLTLRRLLLLYMFIFHFFWGGDSECVYVFVILWFNFIFLFPLII